MNLTNWKKLGTPTGKPGKAGHTKWKIRKSRIYVTIESYVLTTRELPFFLSLCLSILISLCLSIFMFPCLGVCLFVCICLGLHVYGYGMAQTGPWKKRITRSSYCCYWCSYGHGKLSIPSNSRCLSSPIVAGVKEFSCTNFLRNLTQISWNGASSVSRPGWTSVRAPPTMASGHRIIAPWAMAGSTRILICWRSYFTRGWSNTDASLPTLTWPTPCLCLTTRASTLSDICIHNRTECPSRRTVWGSCRGWERETSGIEAEEEITSWWWVARPGTSVLARAGELVCSRSLGFLTWPCWRPKGARGSPTNRPYYYIDYFWIFCFSWLFHLLYCSFREDEPRSEHDHGASNVKVPYWIISPSLLLI